MPYRLVWHPQDSPDPLQGESLAALGQALQELRNLEGFRVLWTLLEDRLSLAWGTLRDVAPDKPTAVAELQGQIRLLEELLEIPAMIRTVMEGKADGRTP